MSGQGLAEGSRDKSVAELEKESGEMAESDRFRLMAIVKLTKLDVSTGYTIFNCVVVLRGHSSWERELSRRAERACILH